LVRHLDLAYTTFVKVKSNKTKDVEFLNNLTQLFSSQDIFYENMFVFLTTFSLLKLDSFLEDSVMATFIARFMDLARHCSVFESLQVTCDAQLNYSVPNFMITIDKLYRHVAWLLG
jgi:hypothetical protein